jgi:hypothetical protein
MTIQRMDNVGIVVEDLDAADRGRGAALTAGGGQRG